MHPTDSARNSDSLYTAEKKYAIGQNASSRTVMRARWSPSSSATRRWSSTSATMKAISEMITPAKRSEPMITPTPRVTIGYSGKKAVRGGWWSYPPWAIARYQTESQRANAAASRFPRWPKGSVRRAGSKAWVAGARPNESTASTPDIRMTSLEVQRARQAKRIGVSVTVVSRPMSASDVLILGSSFLDRHSHQLTAILTIVITLVLALLADRAVAHWAARADLNAAIDTRIRFMRRLITLGILVLGGLFALSQFGGLNKLAAGVLASSAIVAAVVGFAARQTLANLIAGVMLTIAQPLRIGDQVTIEEQTGVVEDVRLNYTILRTAEGRRLFIPNERLATQVLNNDTILDERVRPEASVWLPPAADTDLALSRLIGLEPGLVVRIAETTPEAVRITLVADSVPAPERAGREAALRAAALRALRAEGLLVGSGG